MQLSSRERNGRFRISVHGRAQPDALADEMDAGIQLVEYRRIAFDDIPAEAVDVIQFRCVDEYIEAVAAVFFQHV